MNYNYPTIMYESILAQMYVLLVLFTIFAFTMKKILSENCKKIFFYQKYVHVHVHVCMYVCMYVCM